MKLLESNMKKKKRQIKTVPKQSKNRYVQNNIKKHF